MAYSVPASVNIGAYYVFIAKRSAPATPVTLPLQAVITAGGDTTWIPVGLYKLGDAKAKSTSDDFKIYDGTPFALGKNFEINLSSIETVDAKFDALEVFEGEKCDILCVKNDGSWKYIEYKGVGITLDIDDKLTMKEPDQILIKGTVLAANITDVRMNGLIAAA